MKKCPFCGNEKVRALQHWEIEFEEVNKNDYFAVVCDMSKQGCGATSGYRATKEEEKKNWEKRVE